MHELSDWSVAEELRRAGFDVEYRDGAASNRELTWRIADGRFTEYCSSFEFRVRPPMTEARAREILGTWITDKGGLDGPNWSWYPWDERFSTSDSDSIDLSSDELEAIAWWMRNKKVTA